MQRPMRRKDKEMTKEDALELFLRAEVGVLSLADAQGIPYGVPVNFVVVGKEIVFHCARQGRKLDILAQNPRASFCVTPDAVKVAQHLTYAYRCAIAEGSVRIVTAETEREHMLRALTQKYTSLDEAEISAAIQKDAARTCVLALQMEDVSGKASYTDVLTSL